MNSVRGGGGGVRGSVRSEQRTTRTINTLIYPDMGSLIVCPEAAGERSLGTVPCSVGIRHTMGGNVPKTKQERWTRMCLALTCWQSVRRHPLEVCRK